MLTESRNEEQDGAQNEEHEDKLWCYCQEVEYGYKLLVTFHFKILIVVSIRQKGQELQF